MNVKKLTDKRKDLIFLITYIGYASIYLNRINLSMAGPDMKAAGVLTTSQLGFLGTAFSVVYATGRLLNSMLADTVESKTMIGFGLLGTGIAGALVGILPPFPMLLFLWCANAFAQSMLWSSVLRIVSSIYTDDEKRTARLSLLISSVAAGQMAGILVSVFLLKKMGLKWAFILPGLFTLVLAFIVFLIYPQTQEKNVQQKVKLENPFIRMAELLKIPEVRLAAVPSALMGLLKDNVTLWMAVYFISTYQIDLNQTSGFVMFIPLVGFAARVLFPLLMKLARNNEHLVSMYSFVGSLVASVLLLVVKDPIIAVVSLSTVYACMSLVNSAVISIFPTRYLDKGCMASISGVMDFVAYLGAGIGSTVFGLTIDAWGYGLMFASWAIMSIIGYMIMRRLCISQQKA